ncbi:MAG: redoxin domain-containing protein [Acidobacteriota bacterium]|nr:MAG: redoxin domain-containing protein [Acidobacteriota bacterium]
MGKTNPWKRPMVVAAAGLAAALALLAGTAFYLHEQGFLEWLYPKEKESEVAVRDFRRLAEEAFAAGNFIEPTEASALFWARRAAGAEGGDASFLAEMEGRVAGRLVAEGEALLLSRVPENQPKALDAFTRALALRPDDEKARFGLSFARGTLAFLQDDPEMALAFFEEAARLNPESQELRPWTARVHRVLSDRRAEAGDWDTARRERDEAMSLDPSLHPGAFRLTALENEEKERQRLAALRQRPAPKLSDTKLPPEPFTSETPIAPPFEIEDLEGKPLSLAQYGGKVVLLMFWATWCGPCIMEIPHLNALQKEYGDKGFAVISLSVDNPMRVTPAKLTEFVRKKNIDYRVAMATAKVVQDYGGARNIPTSFIIDRQGRLRAKFVGSRRKEVFEEVIKTLL